MIAGIGKLLPPRHIRSFKRDPPAGNPPSDGGKQTEEEDEAGADTLQYGGSLMGHGLNILGGRGGRGQER